MKGTKCDYWGGFTDDELAVLLKGRPPVKPLTENEAYVLANREKHSFKSLGAELGLSGTRVRQIYVKAKRKTKHAKILGWAL